MTIGEWLLIGILIFVILVSVGVVIVLLARGAARRRWQEREAAERRMQGGQIRAEASYNVAMAEYSMLCNEYTRLNLAGQEEERKRIKKLLVKAYKKLQYAYARLREVRPELPSNGPNEPLEIGEPPDTPDKPSLPWEGE